MNNKIQKKNGKIFQKMLKSMLPLLRIFVVLKYLVFLPVQKEKILYF